MVKFVKNIIFALKALKFFLTYSSQIPQKRKTIFNSISGKNQIIASNSNFSLVNENVAMDFTNDFENLNKKKQVC